ncbi:MAG: hypothetical protein IPN08_04900 [Bacteroidales bacterium]|nr:hypothetical protein [Bacteroidales bacterium]MBK9356721.1 hypothetical protein [Bacteroidales bacterium]
MKLKLFISFLLVPFIIVSCDLNGESHEKYTGYVSVVETIIPDSAWTGQSVPVYARATAPNGCWSDLKLYLGKSVVADTVYGISATGLYESYNGLCTEVLISDDTTFNFKPEVSGMYLFISYSSILEPTYDTLYVLDSLPQNR